MDSGTVISSFAAEAARRFDGANEADVRTWQTATVGTTVTPEAVNFLMGVLSDAEVRTIERGLSSVVMDYLVRAVDRDGAVDLQFASGDATTIPSGSWIVNCTGYVTKDEHPTSRTSPRAGRCCPSRRVRPHSI